MEFCTGCSLLDSFRDDEMFKRQFRLSREDFSLLESLILDHKCRNGYDYEKHIKYATRSSGSPVTLELRLYITLRLCSGAMYLDMIWYGVSLKSIPEIFCSTICEIDEAVDNISFPCDSVGIMKVVNKKCIKSVTTTLNLT